MVTINWEREPGERVEDFVAAYLLLKAGMGNQIRPSQGDGGIDVQIPTPDGWDIYQVKRFARNLGASEKRQIAESWARFEPSLARNKIRSWNLVLPLEPTRENLLWLDELTEGSGITVEWIGLARLDGWAADNPRLADYFFGEGAQRWQELMAQALSAAKPVDASEGQPLLRSVQSRVADLSRALDEVDPFYHYEIEMRTGNLADVSPEHSLKTPPSRPGLVQSTMEQVDDTHYLVTHIFARSPMSTELRPIRGQLNMVATTEEEKEALIRFALYGAPLTNASATVIDSSGPPGAKIPVGHTASAWSMAPASDEQMPPLEIRLLRNEEVVCAVPATGVETSSAVSGPGRWLKAVAGPAVTVEVGYGAPEHENWISVTTQWVPGADPSEMLPGLAMVAALPGAALEVGVRGGPAVVGGFQFQDNEISAEAERMVELVGALVTVQRFTYARVALPSATNLPAKQVRTLLRVTRMLEGEELEETFNEIDVSAGAEFFAGWDDATRPLTMHQPLAVALDDQRWELTVSLRRVFESVRLVRADGRLLLHPGESNAVRTNVVHEA